MERDTVIFDLIKKECQRQKEGIELIASENFVSDEVMEAMGSCLTNKYAEGYPGARYYGGCQIVDQTEQLAIDRACKLFGAEYANVQPHSGAQADIEQLARDGVPLQLNAACLTKPLHRKRYLTWIEGGCVRYLGSDIHMLGSGYQDWEKCARLLEKRVP